jgi:hypothetical protein
MDSDTDPEFKRVRPIVSVEFWLGGSAAAHRRKPAMQLDEVAGVEDDSIPQHAPTQSLTGLTNAIVTSPKGSVRGESTPRLDPNHMARNLPLSMCLAVLNLRRAAQADPPPIESDTGRTNTQQVQAPWARYVAPHDSRRGGDQVVGSYTLSDFAGLFVLLGSGIL